MTVFKKILTCMVMLFAIVGAKAERLLFAHYTVEDGLSSNSVNAVSQDTNGFIWIATRFGISRFDGVNFKNYSSFTDSVMLRNDIYYTFLLPDGKPSFSSSNSVLFSYNEQTDSFEDISSFLPNDTYKHDLKGFSSQPNGENLLSTACGLFGFDNMTNKFHRVAPNYAQHVLDVCVDKFGRYWVGHYEGLSILDKDGNELYVLLKDHLVSELHSLDNNHILICSTVGGSWIAEIDGEKNEPVIKKVDTPFDDVSAVASDKQGILWIGTLNDGLWKCKFDGTTFKYDKIIPLNEREDALAKISSLFVDNNGNVWVPTQSSGVWRTTSINDYTYIKSKDVGIPQAVGASFCETDDGDVLMGTDGCGMVLLDSDFQVKRNISGLSSNSVLTIVKEKDDYLIGYWGGESNRYNIKTGDISKIIYNGIENPRHTTKNICRMADGAIYISAAGDGVYRGENGKWEKLVLTDSAMSNYPDVWVEGTYQKPDGNIVIYTARTIWSNRSGRFKPLLPDVDKSMSSNPLHVNQCVADSGNTLFAATNKGIYCFDKDDICLGTINYIPMGEYASVLIDKNNVLWASGSNGILAIDTKRMTYDRMLPTNAIPSYDYFTGRACLQTRSGDIYFGCKDGFVCIQPNVKSSEKIEHMTFSHLSIRGKTVPVGSDILPYPLKSMDRLNLSYNQNRFSIGFDWVDFSLTNNLVPKYRIPEIGMDWESLGNKRSIDITYLPAGDFTVELAAFSGGKAVQTISLHVSISSPWWNSIWFYCLTFFLSCVLLYILYRLRTRRLEEHRRQLQQMVDERTRDLNNANILLSEQKSAIEARNETLLATLKQKDQMVAVVAHDLKNPMFAIVSTLKRMLSHIYTQAEQQRLLSKLAAESEGLQKQMVSLLQWANGDVALSTYHPSAIDANELVKEAISLLEGLAGEKEIKLRQDGMTQYATWCDSRMFSAIIRNLITNAIKFSSKGSEVSVDLTEAEEYSIIKVTDKGVGMSQNKVNELLSGENITSTSGTEDEVGYGFGFRIVLDYVHKNKGTLNIESKLQDGTTISVSLPKCPDEKLEILSDEKQDVELTINKELLSGKSILIVDDDELLLEHITDLLSPYVEVHMAHNGEEGISQAQTYVPDLIISDVEMPKMNGIEMYEKLTGDLLTSNIPLLFLSAKTDDNVRLKGLSIGAIDYIAKPFDDDELLVKICNFLMWHQKIQVTALSKTLEGEEESSSEKINPLLEKIILLVKENYTNPLYSLTEFTQDLGMSKSTLCRRLKAITDKTAMEILTEYRLNMAKNMLADGNMSVSDVAYAVGFNDPLYFSRRFKQFFGNSPKSAR